MKSIAIGVSEANRLVEIGDCCSYIHLHVFFRSISQNMYNFLVIVLSTFIRLSILDFAIHTDRFLANK